MKKSDELIKLETEFRSLLKYFKNNGTPYLITIANDEESQYNEDLEDEMSDEDNILSIKDHIASLKECLRKYNF